MRGYVIKFASNTYNTFIVILIIRKRFLPTGAGEAARSVQTNVLATTVANRAFVDIFAVGSETRLLIAVVAYALIGAHHILADAVRAYTTGPRALVYVFAGLLVGSQFVSRRALTVEASLGVDANAAATQSRRLLTLIYVWNILRD